MDKVVQNNAAAAQESASAATELTRQAVTLQEVVGELLGLAGAVERARATSGQPAPASLVREARRASTPAPASDATVRPIRSTPALALQAP
jgi:methyl-accepting chemotaxis protein